LAGVRVGAAIAATSASSCPGATVDASFSTGAQAAARKAAATAAIALWRNIILSLYGDARP
jgi:hypothetical protein